MPNFSLIVLTKNEAHNIARCLDSVPVAAEKIVVDSGSTDDTVRIAERHGARIVRQDWLGFSQQRVKATTESKHDWVLFLDADEALSPQAKSELRSWQQEQTPQAEAYAFPRLSYHLGRWIRHGGWYPDWQTRLFDRTRAGWQPGEVHERVQADKTLRFKNPILHWVFEDLSDQIETNNRYSSLGALELARKGKRVSLIELIFHPWFKFLETYVWKLGFLDGRPGLIIAVGAAYSMFLKHAKHWENQVPKRSKN